MYNDVITCKEDLIMNAGRIVPDISLNSLAEVYKRRVLDIITRLQNKTVVFDYDGTMTEVKYAKDRLLPCKDDDVYEYSKSNNIYANVYSLKTMQYIINELNSDDVWVLTVSQDTVVENKTKAIKQAFPEIKNSQIMHCHNAKEKMAILDDIHSKTGKRIVFLEDTLSTLLLAEETFDFIEGVHISSLLP